MNSGIFFFIMILWSPYQSFGETTQNTEDQYRDDRFGGGVIESYSSVPTTDPDPDTSIKPYVPNTPLSGGQGPRFFEEIPQDHQKAPIFSKFKSVFLDCAPVGCDPGQGQCFGNRGKASCHTTGDAIDLHSIRCHGEKYDSNHPVFVRMVQCIRTRFYKGRRWKVLHQDNSGQCSGVGLHSETGKITSCHWDHAHFSVGCRRNGSLMW